MDENKKDEFIPSLTLDPNGTAAAAAVQDAPAPTLTTDAPARPQKPQPRWKSRTLRSSPPPSRPP
jgi:hypothetical protein